MRTKSLKISLGVLLCLVLILPVAAQSDFNDGRLDHRIDAPVVAYCAGDGGIEAYQSAGGEAFRATKAQIEAALGRSFVESRPIQFAFGAAGTGMLAYPDRRVQIVAPGYGFTVPGTACGGYSPDYGNIVDNLVDATGVSTEPSMSATPSHSGYYQPPVVHPQGARTHVVGAGENLFRIGLRYGVHYTEIARANGITNPTRIFVGQTLVIPASK